MSLITAEGLGVWFAGRTLMEDISFAVQPGDRIGLVGPNGSGKSTLLRLLSREREPDAGEVAWARGVRVGYLPQDILELPQGSLVESVRSAVGGREAREAEIVAVEAALAGDGVSAAGTDASTSASASAAGGDAETLELAQRLADLHLELADFEERYGRHRAEEILAGLGFPAAAFDRPVGELSGGWKMRAALAGLLLVGPDVLLLDEPTNHLDIPSLQWFDGFLRRSQKALVLVSHDRAFLNRQIARVLSFEPEGLRSYVGNYDSYRTQRAEEEENLALRAQRQAAERAANEAFIERFRYKATKSRQVQSRVKQLAKKETIQVREARAKVRFRFPEVTRSSRDVLTISGLDKRFGDKVIYQNLSGKVERGDRIAIIGVNGAGKSTLLRLIAGELALDAGSISIGTGVQVAYYAQHHTDTLDREHTVLEEIAALVPDKPQSFVRGVLGSFLFQGDDVDKKISVLSGGERARVALARLLVLPSNLLLMDEPTNHLDLDSAERLVEALGGYGGTLLFVSHNQSFINQLATKVWEVDRGVLHEWKGNLDDYLYHLEQIGRPLGGTPVQVARPVRAVENDRERRQREARERDARAQKTRPIQARITALETEIAALEAELKGLETQLADPALYQDYARAQPMLDRARVGKQRLEECYAQWEKEQELLAAAGA